MGIFWNCNWPYSQVSIIWVSNFWEVVCWIRSSSISIECRIESFFSVCIDSYISKEHFVLPIGLTLIILCSYSDFSIFTVVDAVISSFWVLPRRTVFNSMFFMPSGVCDYAIFISIGRKYWIMSTCCLSSDFWSIKIFFIINRIILEEFSKSIHDSVGLFNKCLSSIIKMFYPW